MEREIEERGKVLLIILLLIALGAGLFFILRGRDTPLADNNNGGSYLTPGSSTTTNNNSSAMIRVASPAPNASVRSPLTVTGEARGNWFFEASFPIKILDANGRELGVSYAQAEGEWMTTEFVPFRGVITFATSTTPTGTLVLEKDNPSGLPQNAAEFRIPIRFSSVNEQTRAIKLYFYNENRDRNAAGSVKCSAQGLVAIDRRIPLTNTPIQDAIRELLKGPTASERLQAPHTEFPLSGVALTGASLSSGALTLSFADPENKTGGGSCRVQILRAMIEATAKQFGGVTSVAYKPTGVFEP